jgi:hypothetical protein
VVPVLDKVTNAAHMVPGCARVLDDGMEWRMSAR